MRVRRRRLRVKSFQEQRGHWPVNCYDRDHHNVAAYKALKVIRPETYDVIAGLDCNYSDLD